MVSRTSENVTYVYLICPVRNCSPETRKRLDEYVAGLERAGYMVHYPHRDVDQSNDDGGLRICEAHRAAMFNADEIHVFWDGSSSGCHFDLGMAYLLSLQRAAVGRPLKFVAANEEAAQRVSPKSFQNVCAKLCTDGYEFDPQKDLQPGKMS